MYGYGEKSIAEEWKQINGYGGVYEISNFGRVKSIGRFIQNHSKKQWLPERILSQNVVGAGYIQVGLHKDGKRKNHYIHRLVAQHFIKNENEYQEVNHKDEDKKNNDARNLEWCDRRYNNTYGTAIKRRVENTDFKEINKDRDFRAMALMAANKRRKAVKQIDKNGKTKTYRSATDAARINGFNQGDICSCCLGKLKTAKGYRWEYA